MQLVVTLVLMDDDGTVADHIAMAKPLIASEAAGWPSFETRTTVRRGDYSGELMLTDCTLSVVEARASSRI